MEVVKKVSINDMDFIFILIDELRKNGITKINTDSLEKYLYYYKNDKKYSLLFQNIKYDNNKINLKDIISNLVLCGVVYTTNNNYDNIYLLSSQGLNIENYDVEEVKLVKELATNYIIRENLSKKQSFNLRIYHLSSNVHYSLIKGKNNQKDIEYNVVTDSTNVMEIIDNKKRNKINCVDPENIENLISLVNPKYKNIRINNSTFAIERQYVDNKLLAANLYTNVSNPQKLEEIINCCSLKENQDEVQILKIK